VVQNLGTYFILYVIAIKWIMCVEKRLKFLECTKTKVDLSQNFRRSLLSYKNRVTIKKIAKQLP